MSTRFVHKQKIESITLGHYCPIPAFYSLHSASTQIYCGSIKTANEIVI